MKKSNITTGSKPMKSKIIIYLNHWNCGLVLILCSSNFSRKCLSDEWPSWLFWWEVIFLFCNWRGACWWELTTQFLAPSNEHHAICMLRLRGHIPPSSASTAQILASFVLYRYATLLKISKQFSSAPTNQSDWPIKRHFFHSFETQKTKCR